MMTDDPEFEIADAFKKDPSPDRAAGLAGRLAPQRPRPQQQRAAQPPPETAGEDEPAGPQRAPTGRQRRRSPRVATGAGDGRLVVALPVALRDRARAYGSSRGETYLDVALAAVQETHPRLPQLVQARHEEEADPIAAPTGGLFEHRPRRRKTPEATAQVTIRGLPRHDRDVLERLVDEVGAANLTELLTVALDEHLPQRPRSLR